MKIYVKAYGSQTYSGGVLLKILSAESENVKIIIGNYKRAKIHWIYP